jgi:hypothetical protein
VKRIYLETTVVSYYTAPPSRDIVVAARQKSTQQLWPKLVSEYDCYVSILVREEAGKGDQQRASLRLQALSNFSVLDVEEAVKELASTIMEGHGIPNEYPEDALHIAVAAVNGMDILLTWNFAHLNNPFTRTVVRQLVEQAGYQSPETCSPDELLEATQ